MFGYIKVYKDELKFREFSLYRYYYCELCKNMGSYSNLSRIFLSYDVTFFLMLNEPGLPADTHCTKCNAVTCRSKKTEDLYDYYAAFSIALIYHKLSNDIIDGDIKKRFSRFMIRRAYKKAILKYPQTGKSIEYGLEKIVEKEKRKETNYLDMAEEFAKCVTSACAERFAPLSDGEVRLKIMEHIIKCIYLIDIIDDVKKDFKHNDYNPLNILANGMADKNLIMAAASLVYDNLSKANSLLMLLAYSDCIAIISNIINFGIPFKLEEIISKYDD